MASWVGVDLVPLSCGQVVGSPQKPGSKPDGLRVGQHWVVDVEIEMDLLRVSVGPFGRDVVGRELHADHPPIFRVEDAMELVVRENLACEHARPEGALGGQVGCIEHDYLTHDLHAQILADARYR